MTQPNHFIGYVVSGSLKDNLNVRLTLPPQQVQEGSFVVVESNDWQFYGLVTDLQLGATDPRFADEQSEVRLPGRLASLLHGQTLFTNLEVMPALMLERGPDPGAPEYPLWRAEHPDDPHPIPVKTVPSHHAPVRLASAGDVGEIFGKPEEDGMFVIGHTREQNHPVCLDLDKFVQRSAGVFGATGTGKSFLTRIILAGLIHHDKTSVLVFDMHNEYGFDDIASDTRQRVVGLKSRFGAKVQIAALGRGTTIRNQTPDFHLEIAEGDITPSDIAVPAGGILTETVGDTNLLSHHIARRPLTFAKGESLGVHPPTHGLADKELLQSLQLHFVFCLDPHYCQLSIQLQHRLGSAEIIAGSHLLLDLIDGVVHLLHVHSTHYVKRRHIPPPSRRS